MERREKQLLKAQLEQQAEQILSEENGTALTVSILAACGALLRTAEKCAPDLSRQQEFNRVYAGYLSLASRIDAFYRQNKRAIGQGEEELLKSRCTALLEAQSRREQAERQASEMQRQCEEARRQAGEAKEKLAAAQAALQEAAREKAEWEAEAAEKEAEKKTMETELALLKQRSVTIEPDIKRLAEETEQAKKAYQDLTACYSELERIQAGIGVEGFVDIGSLADALTEMNRQGAALIGQYDRLLGQVLADVEALQKKIESRRRPGAGEQN